MTPLRLLHQGISSPRQAVATASEYGRASDLPAAFLLLLAVSASVRIGLGFMLDQAVSYPALLIRMGADFLQGFSLLFLIAALTYSLASIRQKEGTLLGLLLGFIVSQSPFLLVSAIAMICGSLGELFLGSVSAQMLFNVLYCGAFLWSFLLLGRTVQQNCGLKNLAEGAFMAIAAIFGVFLLLSMSGLGFFLGAFSRLL